jgi:hypothetical protein
MAEFDFSDAVNPFTQNNPSQEFDFADAVNPFSATEFTKRLSTVDGVTQQPEWLINHREEQSKERSWGEVARDTGSGVMKGLAGVADAAMQTGEFLEDAIPMGGLAWKEGDVLPSYQSPGEYQQKKEQGMATPTDATGSAMDHWEQGKSKAIKEDAAYVANADGFADTFKRVAERPRVIGNAIADSIGYVVPGLAAARAAKIAGATGKGIATTVAGAGAITEGGAARSQAVDEVMKMPLGDLLEHSPDYQELIKSGVSAEAARMRVAADAGFTAQAITMPVSFLASALTGAAKAEADFFTGEGAKDFFTGLFKQAGEEAAQEMGSQLGVNVGVSENADNRRGYTEDLGNAAAMGVIMGPAQQAGMKAVDMAGQQLGKVGAAPQDDGEIDLPQNGEEIGGGIVDELPENKPEQLQLGHDPQRMIVLPDGTTAWEREAAEMLPSAAATRHPAFPKLTIDPDQVEAELTGDTDIDSELRALMAELDQAESITNENFNTPKGTTNADSRIETGASRATQHPGISNLANDETALPQPQVQEVSAVRSQGNQSLPTMEGQFPHFPERRGNETSLRFDAGEIGQQQGIRTGERDLGNPEGSGTQPPEQPIFGIQREKHASGGVGGIIGSALQAVETENSGLRVGARAGINDSSKLAPEDQQNVNLQRNNETNESMGEGIGNELQNSQEQNKHSEMERGKGTDNTGQNFDPGALIDKIANEAATSPLNNLPEPTIAQLNAGNYKKAKVRISGLDISIENPRGSTRSGIDANGNKWENKLHSHYGYIRGTESSDGEQVDVFIGPSPESQKVFIVDQLNKDGTFDEVKVLIGFDSKLKARSGYKSNYSSGWKVGPITSMSTVEFKEWLKSGDTKRPLSPVLSANTGVATAATIDNPNHVKSESKAPITESEKPKSESNLPPILTQTKKQYISGMAKERALKKDSPGYADALKKVEADYEQELDRAHATLPFEEFNRLNSDSPESVNRQAWESLREEYGTEYMRYSLGGTGGISIESTQAVIDRIKKSYKNPHITIRAVSDINGFPARARERLLEHNEQNENDPITAKALIYDGTIFVNASALQDADDVERAIFHELHGHYGTRVLFGRETSTAMGRLYLAIGGAKGIRDIAKTHNIDLSKYEEILKGESPGKRAEIVADELLAHIAQDSKPSVKRWLQELIGSIRTWLRAHGFKGLGQFSDSEIMALLKRTREAATELKLDGGSVLRVLLDDARSNATAKADTAEAAYSLSGLPPKTRKIIGSDPVLAAWTLLAQSDDAFQLPVSDKKTLEEIFSEVAPGIKIRRAPEFDDDGAQVWAVNPKKDTLALVFQKRKSVWIDVADYSDGQGGRGVYNAVANYAYNTGKTFIGDPAGLSDKAMARRLENMISSALKFGTTDHLWPHERQEQGGAGVPPIKWKAGDDAHNLKEMINASHQATLNQFPEIKDLRYNPVTDQVEGVKDGKVYTRADIEAIAESKRTEAVAGKPPVTAGRATLERAVLTHSILRGTRQEQFNVLAALSNQRSERLAGILYSLAPGNNQQTRPSGGFSVSGRSKDEIIQRGLDALGGINSDWKNKTKRMIKYMVAPMGNLPDFAKALKIARDGKLNSDDMEMQFVMKDFEDKVFDVYQKNYGDLKAATRKEINDYLKGDRTNVKLTAQTVAMLDTLRNHIKSMSGRLAQSYMRDIDQLQSEAATAKGAELARITSAIEVLSKRVDTIVMNVDTYLHRSYRAFDDKNWPKKLKKHHRDVYEKAIEFLARQAAGDKQLTEDHYEEATKKADLILHEGTAYGNFVSFISEGKLGAKDLGITKQRKSVPPEIRALLGEYEDPALNYAKSVIKMSRLIHNSEFLQEFKRSGIESGIIFTEDNREIGATEKIAGENTEMYSPLNGLYTFPEVLKSLKDATNQIADPEWLKKLVLISGAIKYGKTVLAPTTAMRNLISAINFVVGNGHFNLTHAEKAWRVTKTYFSRNDYTGSRAYIKKMLSLGVLYDSPNVRELQDFINKIDESDYLGSGFVKGLKRYVLDNAQTFYGVSDDFWKIIGFENEKAALIGHHGMSEAEAEVEAAKRIRNTYPTYSLVGRGVRNLGRYPFLAAFPSFTSEVIRTTYHRVNYIIQDGKKLGYTNPHVLKKVTGFALQASINYALAAVAASIYGISDEEDEAIRDGLPDWSKNSTLIITGRDDKGNFTYYDIGWMDTNSYLKKPISALMRDDHIGSKMLDAMKELTDPFISPDILPSAINKYWENLTNPNKLPSESTLKFMMNLAPGFATNIENFIHAFTDHTDDSGKVYREADEMLALLGVRRSTLDTKNSLTYRAYGYKDDKQRASASFRKMTQSLAKISEGELKNAYIDMIEKQRKAWDKMRRSVRLSMKAGLEKNKAIDALVIAGVSKADSRRLVDNLEFEFTPPVRQSKLLYRKAALQEEKEVKERLQKRLEFLRKLYRTN